MCTAIRFGHSVWEYVVCIGQSTCGDKQSKLSMT